jgi:hypothetical protein
MVPNEQELIETIIIRKPGGKKVAIPVGQGGKPITPELQESDYDAYGRPVKPSDTGGLVDEKI